MKKILLLISAISILQGCTRRVHPAVAECYAGRGNVTHVTIGSGSSYTSGSVNSWGNYSGSSSSSYKSNTFDCNKILQPYRTEEAKKQLEADIEADKADETGMLIGEIIGGIVLGGLLLGLLFLI